MVKMQLRVSTPRRSWVMMLFGLPFFLVGLTTLLLGPLDTFWQHARSASWDRVPAFIDQVELLSSRSSNSTTYEVSALYRYQYRGRDYIGQRVGYDIGKDNIGRYHQTLAARLQRHHHNDTPVMIWVNPKNPEQTYLVRDLRWPKIALTSVFALIFGGVGGVMIWAGAFMPVPPAEPSSVNGPIYSSERYSYWFWLGFGGLCLALSTPALFAIPSELAQGNWAILVILLFVFLGLWLLRQGHRGWRNWRYYGPLPVLMDPQPGAIGGDIGGRIRLPIPLQADNPYRLTLQCLHSYVSGSGKNRRRNESLLWQQEYIPFITADGDGTELRFIFQPPAHLPASEPQNQNSYHLWKLLLCGSRQPVPLERTYTLPVRQGEQRSQLIIPDTHTQQQAELSRVLALESVDSQIKVTPIDGGLQIHSPFGLHIGMKLGLFLVGVIFAAAATFLIGLAMEESGMLWIMAGIFALFGYPMLVAGLFAVGRSLTAEIRSTRLHTVRYWFGIPLWRRHLNLSQAAQLSLQEGTKTSDGRRHTEYVHLVAKEQGRSVRIAEDIAGRQAAEVLRDSLIRLLGLR